MQPGFPAHNKTPSDGLLKRTLRGLQITTSVTALKTIVDFACQLLLVRLLVPQAFGALAFLYSTAGFFSCLANWGGAKYIIQKRKLHPNDVNTIFTTELLVGVLLAVLWNTGALSFLRIFGKEYLGAYVSLFTFWFILERLQIPRAILEKDMAFGKSNTATFLGAFAGAVLSVILAWRGCGVYSLIIGLLFRSFASAVFLWILSPVRPQLRFDSHSIPPFFKFGLPLTLTSVFTFYYWNVDYVIVGRWLGDTQLGFYYIAFKFPHYLLQLQALVSTVVYPAFSRAKDDGQLKRGFTLATKYSGVIALLPCVVVLIFGEGLVRYGLGAKWLPALRPFQIFTCLATFRMITVHWYDVYLSKGKTLIMPLLTGINAVGVTLGAYLGARYWGLVGVAAGVTAVNVSVILFAVNYYLKKILPVCYFSILKLPIIVAIATFGFSLLIKNIIRLPIAPLDFAIKLTASILFYSALYIIIDRASLRELLRKSR